VQNSLALGIGHLVFVAGQWSQERVKALPNNKSSWEEHWISGSAFRGTASNHFPPTRPKEG